MKRSIFLWNTALLFLPAILFSQVEDLTQDTAFFQKQKVEYQRWLDHTGLGSALRVYALEVKPQQLSLFLTFPYQQIDSITVAWGALKKTFEKDRATTLEQTLFYKMADMMEVPQQMVNVLIYDTYDLLKEPLFYRIIYFENGRMQVEESNPRSKRTEIVIKPADLSDMKKRSVQDFQKHFDRQTVYNKIYAYAKKRFEVRTCEQRNPRIRPLESEEILRFEITDLCREVLTDEANPLLCQILNRWGRPCNWVKRELLTFTVVYQEIPAGFQLSIEIDGKYGSGFYENVRRGGYLSMEIDFDEYLERYADFFKEDIKQLLLNGKP